MTGLARGLVFARFAYISFNTLLIAAAASVVRRGSALRCAIACSRGSSGRAVTGEKNLLGGIPNQAHSLVNDARSGCAPPSTRDMVLKLTPASAAAARSD